MSPLDKELSAIVTEGSVFTCKVDETIGSVIEKMAEKNIGSVCVVDDEGKVAGIFTERDFLKKIGMKANESLFAQPIKDFMTANPKTVKENRQIRHCFGLMRMGRFRHLIVVDENNFPKRMVSLRDGFYFMCDSYEGKLPF